MVFSDWVAFNVSRPACPVQIQAKSLFPFGPWIHRLILVAMLVVTAVIFFFASK